MGHVLSCCRILCAACLLWTSACAFDASGLGECRSHDECTEGRCVDRVCVPNLPGDTGGDRADGLPDLGDDVPLDGGEDLDAGDDAPDGGPDLDDPAVDPIPDDDAPSCPPEPFCDDNELVSCDGLGNLQRVDCDESDTCDDADLGCRCDEDQCVPRVCLPNAEDCVGDQAVLCDGDGGGFTPLETCEPIEMCVGGDCEATECEPDTTFCLNDVLVTCSSAGELSIVEDCRVDGYCDDEGPSCEDRNCEPGARRCAVDPENGDDLVEECDARGVGFELADTCFETQTCSNGVCEGPICTPGEAPSCIGTNARAVCNGTGTGYDTVSCGDDFFCRVGEAGAECQEGVCEPGASQCLPGERFETCNEAGSGYDPPVDCAGDEFCEGGECLDQVCNPGDVACENDFTLRFCNENGSEETVEPCGDDRYCDSDEEPPTCVDQVCEPDEPLCDEQGDAVLCDSVGSGTTPVEECDFTCFMGECRGPFCGDGLVTEDEGEECDDRNEDACDGCEDCLELFGLGVTPTSDSIATRPTWLPSQSLLTIEAWVRVTGAGQIAGIGGEVTDNVRLFVTNEGLPAFHYDLGGNQTVQATGPTSIMDGAWHHLAGQRTTSDNATLYVDGVEVASTNESHGNNSLDSSDIWIGGQTVFVPGTFTIDGLRISDVVRYTSTFEPPRTLGDDDDTMALYHLDEGTGTTAVDSSGVRDIPLENVSWVADNCFGGHFDP